MRRERSIAACVRQISQDLESGKAKNADSRAPLIRRKIVRLLSDCGRQNITRPFLAEFDQALTTASLFTRPSLVARPLLQDECVEFSTRPFDPQSVFFETEAELREFLRRAVGVMPPLEALQERAYEYRLPSGKRIDLLCEEISKNGKGALVAIEFKRDDPTYGVVAQLDAYLTELAKTAEGRGRQVRGLIISGPERDGRAADVSHAQNRIDWYYYSVALQAAELSRR
jgi:hypothetical protein